MALEAHIEKLLKQRYYRDGENWEQLVNRVVNHVGQNEPEETRELFRFFILNRIFLPNSPCLVNANTRINGLFACFTVGPSEDSLEAHLEALADVAAVGKKGGGCGFTGTFIRPKGSPVAGSTHGYAYGPNAYAERVNSYLDMMTQGGFRKMALMYAMRSDHPDLEDFINLKQGAEGQLARFNQSVMATDEWMRQAATNKDSKAASQLRQIAHNAWNNGEPGLLFYDTINNNTPYQTCGCKIEVTNPCGEQPIPQYGSCNLGSINVNHDYFHDLDGKFLPDNLIFATRTLTRFLDDVGTVNEFPNNKFESWYKKHRPIGVGIMGLADYFLRHGLVYGSNAALDKTDKIMEAIYKTAKNESEALGKERGIPEHCRGVDRRNITLTSIAPTGSISFIADCSSGIEPIFAPIFYRQDERGETYEFVHPTAKMSFFRSVVNPDTNKTIPWQAHVDIQAVTQKHVDSGVSKTVNLPNTATEEDVLEIYQYAYKSGCKGITVYRDGSRQIQVLTTSPKVAKNNAPKRPTSLPCTIKHVKWYGDWLVAVGYLDNEPFELFAFKHHPIDSKNGVLIKRGDGKYDLETDTLTIKDITKDYVGQNEEALTRIISGALRHGMDIQFIVEQLGKSRGAITSFAKVIYRTLKDLLPEDIEIKGGRCPDCGHKLTFEEGCKTCKSCGYSACN